MDIFEGRERVEKCTKNSNKDRGTETFARNDCRKIRKNKASRRERGTEAGRGEAVRERYGIVAVEETYVVAKQTGDVVGEEKKVSQKRRCTASGARAVLSRGRSS